MKIFTDKLQEIETQNQKPLEEYMETVPVDMNGAYVATDKYDADNLEETNENINWRFSMQQPYSRKFDKEVKKK